ncbi:hypothetical protein Ahia01_000005000 [Argonauta hians]
MKTTPWNYFLFLFLIHHFIPATNGEAYRIHSTKYVECPRNTILTVESLKCCRPYMETISPNTTVSSNTNTTNTNNTYSNTTTATQNTTATKNMNTTTATTKNITTTTLTTINTTTTLTTIHTTTTPTTINTTTTIDYISTDATTANSTSSSLGNTTTVVVNSTEPPDVCETILDQQRSVVANCSGFKNCSVSNHCRISNNSYSLLEKRCIYEEHRMEFCKEKITHGSTIYLHNPQEFRHRTCSCKVQSDNILKIDAVNIILDANSSIEFGNITFKNTTELFTVLFSSSPDLITDMAIVAGVIGAILVLSFIFIAYETYKRVSSNFIKEKQEKKKRKKQLKELKGQPNGGVGILYQ